MSRLKGVAIGAGYFSQFHYDAWSRIGDVELTGVCDLDSARAQDAAQKYGIPNFYSQFGEMLAQEKPDFVDIITRPDSHLELTRIAAKHGVDVICQKPLAPTIEESRELVEVAKRGNIRLMVHENFRFQPWYREIKQLLATGEVGERLHTLQIRTRTGDGWQADAYLGRQPYFREMERFLVFEMGVHFIDTLRFLGGEIDGVFANLRRLNDDIAGEDTGTVLFEYDNGAIGIWDANRFNESNAEDPRYTFGEVLVEANGGSIRLHLDGSMTIQPLGQPERQHQYAHAKRNFASDCVLATQQHFVDGLINSTPFETSGEAYLKTLEIQEAVYHSADTRQPVRGLAKA